jgi:hypothetical protein
MEEEIESRLEGIETSLDEINKHIENFLHIYAEINGFVLSNYKSYEPYDGYKLKKESN